MAGIRDTTKRIRRKMKKNKIIIAASALLLSATTEKDVLVIEEKRFAPPSTPSEDWLTPSVPILKSPSNPWPEPHKSSKRRRYR